VNVDGQGTGNDAAVLTASVLGREKGAMDSQERGGRLIHLIGSHLNWTKPAFFYLFWIIHILIRSSYVS
jgi:hypothetical protein